MQRKGNLISPSLSSVTHSKCYLHGFLAFLAAYPLGTINSIHIHNAITNMLHFKATRTGFLSGLKGMTFYDHSNISHSFSIEKISLFQLPAFEAFSYPPQPACWFKWVTIFNLVPSLHCCPPPCLTIMSICSLHHHLPVPIKRIYTISGKTYCWTRAKNFSVLGYRQNFKRVEIKYGVICFERVCCHLEILCKDKAGYIVDIGGKK